MLALEWWRDARRVSSAHGVFDRSIDAILQKRV